MKFRLHWIDVTENLRMQKQPVAFMDRPKMGGDRSALYGSAVSANRPAPYGEFWVPVNALNEAVIDWAPVDSGDVVPIMLHAYTTVQRARSMLTAAGLEMGMRAGYDLAKRCHKVPVEVTMAVGSECIETENGFQYFLGMAIQVE